MSRFLPLLVFLAAALYLAREGLLRPASAPAPNPIPSPTVEHLQEAAPVFSPTEIDNIRQSLLDSDAGVRWAAIELLYNIRDPQLSILLERLISEDPDTEMRIKIVGLMKGREELVRLGGLVKGLRDIDQGVRIASLKALGDIGDPSVSLWVAALLKDTEPEVRVAALRTLGRFHEKRKAQFKALVEKLKQDYENAQRRRTLLRS